MAKKKSAAEAKAERLTWFFLVLVFAILSMIPEDSVPNIVVPLSGAIILLGSGVYQYARKWTVSPVTWIAGSLMLVMGFYNYQFNPNTDLTGLVLITFALVILVGVLTNET